MELFHHVIRGQILIELLSHGEWYQGLEELSDKCENFRHFLEPPLTTEEYEEVVSAARPSFLNNVQWSPFEHCQVISNVLKRPVCLFAALDELNMQESFIFLPLRHKPEDCYKYPLALAWQKRNDNGQLELVIPFNDVYLDYFIRTHNPECSFSFPSLCNICIYAAILCLFAGRPRTPPLLCLHAASRHSTDAVGRSQRSISATTWMAVSASARLSVERKLTPIT
jgi:hypothetical protein